MSSAPTAGRACDCESLAPLELYVAERDSELMLAQARAEAPSDSPRLAELSETIRSLSAKHTVPIRTAKAFLDSSAARDNIARREVLDAEIGALESELKGVRDSQASLNRSGSLDAYMQKRKLDDQLRAKQRVIDVKRSEVARLQEDFDRLATRAGVLGA